MSLNAKTNSVCLFLELKHNCLLYQNVKCQLIIASGDLNFLKEDFISYEPSLTTQRKLGNVSDFICTIKKFQKQAIIRKLILAIRKGFQFHLLTQKSVLNHFQRSACSASGAWRNVKGACSESPTCSTTWIRGVQFEQVNKKNVLPLKMQSCVSFPTKDLICGKFMTVHCFKIDTIVLFSIV